MYSTKSTYHLFIIILLFCYSCTNKYKKDDKIVYELTEKERKEILKILTEVDDKEKHNLYVDFYSDENEIYLCFDENPSIRAKEIYSITNRFLKLSDNLLIPVVFSQDYSLTISNNFLTRVGCHYQYIINLNTRHIEK